MSFTEGLEQKYVLIVGDVMVDSYLWGTVTRISPEAPVPIVSVNRRENRLGGAANVALNLRAMGANVVVCSVLGCDDTGRAFQQLLFEHDIDSRGVIGSTLRRTTVKSRVIGNRTHIVRFDEEDTTPLNDDDTQALLERIRQTVKVLPIGAIIMQDYDKGCITPRLIDEVADLARRKGILLTVDPKHRNFRSFHDVTLFKPNLKELREGLNRDIDDSTEATLLRDLDEASLQLHHEQHIDIVMVTLSERGIYACDFRQATPTTLLLPARQREVADVSGAGDTVISIATLGLMQGLPLQQVVECANLAGGLVCEKVGVVPIDRQQLLDEMVKLNQ